MRAILMLVLLLALITLFSYHEPLGPFWKERMPDVMTCLDEGRYKDAWDVATAGTPPGEDSRYCEKSEPRGEPAPSKPVPVEGSEPFIPEELPPPEEPPPSEELPGESETPATE